MEDIDFSEATFWDVMFTTDCDLSRTIPPKDGQHLLIKDWPKARQAAMDIIDGEWNGVMRERGLRTLSQIQNNPMTIISLPFERDLITKYYPDPATRAEFSQKLCDLLIRVANQTNV
jgi:hypothetical protein